MIRCISNTLYRRSFSNSSEVDKDSTWVWFSQVRGYGSAESYGPFLHEWKVKDATSGGLRLLDVSSEDRSNLALVHDMKPWELGCDEQYSGGNCNKRFHNTIMETLLLNKLDGTFAQEYDEDEEETCGVSEVVLFTRSVLSKMQHVSVSSEGV